MAEFITDLINPRQLTAAVREASTGALPFEGIIPTRETDDLKQQIMRVDLTASPEVARYRNWETVPDIGRRPGFEIEEYEIAPLGWSYRLNEEDFKRLGRLRDGSAERGDRAVIDTIFNDALNASQAVENRITLTHAELLQTGGVTLDEFGNPEAGQAVAVSFPVPANQLNVVPTGAAWSDPVNGKPITDLKTFEATYRANNQGRNPDAWAISTELASDLAVSQQVINQAFPYAGTTPGAIDDAMVATTLRRSGIVAPLVVMNDVERPALDGSGSGRVINNRRLIGLQVGMANTYFTDPPVLAVMASAGNARLERRDARGIIAYATSDIRPPVVVTTSEAVALPLLERPSALFVATV